ncbi:MAG: GNAT family N-acetyltransferase [Desulfoprunum sp.]|nr:GNAT family N-acetyltransferase [Desulfoprunum sp.]
MEWQQGEFTITTRQDDLDIEMIHGFLSTSYWAKGIPKAIVEKAIKNSLSFGVYHNGSQIGFGRAITDRATFAYLADIFILPEFRGRGLGKWLISCFLAHPELQGLRRWLLATSDAHGLYRQNGFGPLKKPENFMEIIVPELYQRK